MNSFTTLIRLADARPANTPDGIARLIGRCAPADLPCQVHDAELWFADDPADLERAKALCADCPVRAGCLAGALDRREFTGVWGGQIFDNGRIVTHKRPRGRPRKGSIAPRRYRPVPAVSADRPAAHHVPFRSTP